MSTWHDTHIESVRGGAHVGRPVELPLVQDRSLWPLILAVGGGSWLIVTGTEVLFLWDISGTEMDGAYVVSSSARLLSHALVFAIAALAYRVLLVQGWPGNPLSRLRVVVTHLLLGGAVLVLAPTALAFSAGVVDGRYAELQEQLANPFALSQMQIAGILRFWLPPYALGLALVALVHLARRYHRDSLQLATLSAKYASARLAMLSAQLQPHFLFNSLHAISELVDESPARATDMIARLGDFLRHALDTSAQPWVSVETELAGLEAYLAVQRTRFGERLQVQMAIDPDALALTIPSLLLQPLVENAVEHGRAGPERSLLVDIRVRRTDLRLHIEIINSTPRLAEILPRSKYGNGLRNADERLHAAYGAEAALAVGPDPLRGTLATLTTPAHVGLRDGWVV